MLGVDQRVRLIPEGKLARIYRLENRNGRFVVGLILEDSRQALQIILSPEELNTRLRELSGEASWQRAIRYGHISTPHVGFARRPLVAARAAVFASLGEAPLSSPRTRGEAPNPLEQAPGHDAEALTRQTAQGTGSLRLRLHPTEGSWREVAFPHWLLT